MDLVRQPARQEQRLPMSYEEYRAWWDGESQAEWVNGEVIVFMPPNPRHADLVSFLTALLRLYVQFFHLGRVLSAPVEMRAVPDGNAREPDLLFVARPNLDRIAETRIEGPADLVVEVISPESAARDRTDKFYEYQQAGVSEYWILDPRPGMERSDFWVLDPDGRYRPVPLQGGIYRSTAIDGFWLREGWLWEEEKPDVLLTFAEIAGLPAELVEGLRRFAQESRD